tara:strand:- start:917 stop:1666 length:750 start_codon:yes stop_codon:yes gene_type:complete
MKPKIKYSAPALENGLDILELLSQYPTGLSFTEIMSRIDSSKSTIIRLLKVLMNRNYICQNDSGRYIAGPNMALTGKSTIFDLLRHYSQPLLEELSDSQAGTTAVLIGFTGLEMVVLNRLRREGSVYMQEQGTVRIDFSYAPWAWIFYSGMTESQQKAVAPNINTPDFTSRLAEWMDYYEQHGYCFDKEYFWSHIRRIAAPVKDGSGRVVAALAVGGNKITIPDKEVNRVGKRLVISAKELSEKIRHFA